MTTTKTLRDALELAIRQNEHDMLLTGDELRKCRAALATADAEGAGDAESCQHAVPYRFHCEDCDGPPMFSAASAARPAPVGAVQAPADALKIERLEKELREAKESAKYANADADMYANAWQRELASYDGMIRNKRHHIDAMVLTTRDLVAKLRAADARVRELQAKPPTGVDAGIAIFYPFGDKFDIKSLQMAGKAATICMAHWRGAAAPAAPIVATPKHAAFACSTCYGTGYCIDGKSCPSGCRHPVAEHAKPDPVWTQAMIDQALDEGLALRDRLQFKPQAEDKPEPAAHAPEFNEAEFNAMVERGTKVWNEVPDDWLEQQRGNVPVEHSKFGSPELQGMIVEQAKRTYCRTCDMDVTLHCGDKECGLPVEQVKQAEGAAELCQWLRDHSSGAYRQCAEAADLIERLTGQQAGAVDGEDTARIDWLGERMTGASDSERYLPFRVYWGNKGATQGIRVQIDKARAASANQKGEG